MSSSNSKNIIIIILLVLNMILLSVVIVDRAQEREARRTEIMAIEEVLGLYGIEADNKINFNVSAPRPCVIERKADTEYSSASALLGSCSLDDLGGNIILYTSDQGQALIRGNGEMDAIFHGNRPKLDFDGRSAAKFMGKCDFELFPASAQLNGSDISMHCALDGYCVYNAKLTLSYSSGELSMVNGTIIFNGSKSFSDEKLMNSTTAIMRFLEIVRNEGYICSRIIELEAGYVQSVSVSGVCTLDPVWRIKTDTGELFINAVNGKIETPTI